VLIDPKQLSSEALQGVIESYIQSNINEAEVDIPMADWINKIQSHLLNGELVIEFSEVNQTVYLKDPKTLCVDSELNSEELQ
jgi:uncharacterized protein YheU (UPF0270 family)